MKAVVGLGNPGPNYRDTRHNMGFAVLDHLARRVALAAERYQGQALVAEVRTRGSDPQSLLLVKPLTYMNNSGTAVRRLLVHRRLSLGDLLVVYDDLDLPLGRIRLRPGGGSGGHRGMESIISALGTDTFARLRCGIGRPEDTDEDVIDYVLTPFSRSEQETVDAMMEQAVAAVLRLVNAGIEAAMNDFNSRDGND